MQLPPEDVLRGALHVLSIAGVYTRNWTLNDEVSRKQINDLWEALHPIPDLLTRWRGDDAERELLMYLREYKEKWSVPNLEGAYRDGIARTRG
jgi:hypothetical protein